MTQIFISTGNSTTIPLGAGEEFVGIADYLSSWEEVDINLAGGPAVAPGTLYFEFSPDSVNWDISVPLAVDGPNGIPINLRSVLLYFRVRYVNGSTPLDSLRLTVILHRFAAGRLTRFIHQTIDTNEPVEMVRVAKTVLPDYAETTIQPRSLTDGYLTVGVTNLSPGVNALKVDVVKTVGGGSVGVGGTSSSFLGPFPDAGTAVGFYDGYYMQSAKVFDLDTLGTTEFILGTNLRTYGAGGSVEIGTLLNPFRTDPTGVTTQPVSGTVTADAGTGTFTVGGTVTADAGTGNFTVVQATASNLNANVSGTVTANIGTTNGLALDSSLSTIDTDIKATQPRDITDRIARQLGIIYGSQGQPFTQTATNYNLQAELAVGGTLIDPRQIRALTSSDVVTANAGTGTFTVGGTVTANAGTGNFTVVQSTASNLNANVSGTVTANIGTTNGLALDTSVNGLLVGQGSTTSGEKGPLVQGAVTTSAPSYTTGQTSPLNLNTSGALRVDASGAPLLPPSDFTATGTIAALNDTVTVSAIGCSHVTAQVTGTWTGRISFKGTIDGSTFFDIISFPIVTANGPTTASASLGVEDILVDGYYITNAIGYVNVRLIAEAWTSGSASIFLRGTTGGGPPEVQPIIPSDSAALDPFSRQRVSNPESIFSSKQIVDSQPLFWDDQQTAGASTSSAYQTNQASTKMTVTNNVVGTRVRQTFRRFNYQSGKGTLATLTGVLVAEGGVGNAFTNRKLGLYDGYNGLYFGMNGTTVGVGVRTFTSGSAVDTFISQSNWNLDTLDGSGFQANPSGLKLDVAATQIFCVDFQWLGVGRIRFGFNIGGRYIYCHQVLNANINTLVYMSTPNLPLRYEIQSLGGGTSATSSLLHICSAVEIEAGFEDIGFQIGIDTGATLFATGNNTNVYALLAVRLKSTSLGATIVPVYITAMCTDSASYRYGLVLNPTIAGAALSYTPVTNSSLEFATTANTNTLTGGTVIFSDYGISAKNSASSIAVPGELQLGSSIAGVSDVLVLFVQPTPQFAGHYVGAINYREII